MTLPQPLAHRVLVELPPAERVSAGGIVIPETVDARQMQGTVRAVGSDAFEVEPGDEVLFRRSAGEDFDVGDGRTYRMMDEEEILAVVQG